MGNVILQLLIYIATIFLFFLILGFLPDISPNSPDSIQKIEKTSSYEPYNQVESFSKKEKKEVDSEVFIKRFKRSESPSQEKETKSVDSKEDFIKNLKNNYKGKIESINILENGFVIEFRGEMFDSDKSIYSFHKKIDDKLRSLGFKEARYLWYGSDGDYTIFNLTR